MSLDNELKAAQHKDELGKALREQIEHEGQATLFGVIADLDNPLDALQVGYHYGMLKKAQMYRRMLKR
jgi:hypothetical protein